MAGIRKFVYALVLFLSIFVVMSNEIDIFYCQDDSDCICDRESIPKCIGGACFCWKRRN
ncbi:putative Late nodulin [Lupinus albus]|uniref:Putative Late nodulin n=1 Tax=Lupinus albus TaxID=3870 RepID=A0A6A4QFF3_LUPAL|nr:putative Late nodulin [Lupinus albus]